MSKQDDQIAQIVTDMNAQFSALGSAVANVAADEQNILKQLQDLQANAGELTPENLAKDERQIPSIGIGHWQMLTWEEGGGLTG